MRKILILVTHSLGELDVVLPLFAAINAKQSIDVTIIITVRGIYSQYVISNFYQYCAKTLGIRIKFCQLPNKFDRLFKLLARCVRSRILIEALLNLFLFVKVALIAKDLLKADCYMHEVTNQWRTTKVLYFLKKITGRPIASYMHGHAITTDSFSTRVVRNAEDVVYLNFHEQNRKNMEKMGLWRQEIVGYPKLQGEWKTLVKKYPEATTDATKCVVIFTRPIHPFYMDEKSYRFLLSTAYSAIRNIFDDTPIIIKAHPREDTTVLELMIADFCMRNVEMSTEHPAILANKAWATVTFWGSTVFDGLSMGTPAIEYFIEPPKFRETERSGSSYKRVGFHSAANQRELESIFRKVKHGTYRESTRLIQLREIGNNDFLEKYSNCKTMS